LAHAQLLGHPGVRNHDDPLSEKSQIAYRSILFENNKILKQKINSYNTKQIKIILFFLFGFSIDFKPKGTNHAVTFSSDNFLLSYYFLSLLVSILAAGFD
jgi:hypothetical protein